MSSERLPLSNVSRFSASRPSSTRIATFVVVPVSSSTVPWKRLSTICAQIISGHLSQCEQTYINDVTYEYFDGQKMSFTVTLDIDWRLLRCIRGRLAYVPVRESILDTPKALTRYLAASDGKTHTNALICRKRKEIQSDCLAHLSIKCQVTANMHPKQLDTRRNNGRESQTFIYDRG